MSFSEVSEDTNIREKRFKIVIKTEKVTHRGTVNNKDNT